MKKIKSILIFLVFGLAMIISCKKDPVAPTLTTSDVSNITINSVTTGGEITDGGGADVTIRGVCWDTSSVPSISCPHTTDGNGVGSFISNLTDLTPNTFYHLRAYATNKAGTSYGNEISFNTKLADVDGNIYNVVKIGTQVWMAENLKTTKYRNGDIIGTTSSVTLDITTEIAPKYEWAYNGDEDLAAIYGRLYTWFAATDSRNICPTGFHMPLVEEWETLKDFLGGESLAGGKLKEAGINHWQTPNTGATNETGFSSLPGGYRSIAGEFADMGVNSYHWSTTVESAGFVWGQGMSSSAGSLISHSWAVNDGVSVRCLED